MKNKQKIKERVVKYVEHIFPMIKRDLKLKHICVKEVSSLIDDIEKLLEEKD